MGLYAVPQSADTTDPTVAAAVARFKLRCPKPEAILGTGGPALLPDTTIALHLERAYDSVRSALGDRLTDGVTLLQVDASLDGAASEIASMTLYRARGFNRQQGGDSTIEAAGQEALAFLARCRPGGADGKTENPIIVTGDGVNYADTVGITSALGQPGASGRCDAWIGARAQLAGGHGEGA